MTSNLKYTLMNRSALLLLVILLVVGCKKEESPTSPSMLTEGLVAWYPLDGNANDLSGNGNNGSASGITYASEGSRTFAQFASTSYIEVLDNSTFDFSSATGVTIVAWVKQTQSTSGYMFIKMGPSGSSDDEYSLEISSNGQLYGALNSPSTNGAISSVTKLLLNNWYNVALIWNQADRQISFYINGTLDNTVSSSVTSIQNTTIPLRIGIPTMSGYKSFAGGLDNVRIYKRALAPEEIAAIYSEK